MREARVDRYLRLMGFERPPHGLKGLRQLVEAHLLRVPFENVSKLLLIGKEGAGRVSTLDEFLDGIEYHDLGGTCYTANPFLAQLLRELGYEADLLSADMNSPHVHSCIRVRIRGRQYHVDVGNAAPFVEPFALDELPQEFARGEMRWRFDRAEDGRVRCRVFADGEHVHGYVANDEPFAQDDFSRIVLDSFQPGRTFMSLLRIVRIFPEHMVELKNRTLRVHSGRRTSETTLQNMAELQRAVKEQFLMPRCPVKKAVEVLERRNGIEFFGAPQESTLYG